MSWIIERLARSIFNYRAKVYSFEFDNWNEVSEFKRNLYRVEATAILKGLFR